LLASLTYSALAVPQNADTTKVTHYEEEGQKALAEGRFGDAELAFEKLRALEPRVAEVYANLGLIYFEERKFDLAVPALRQALKLKPSLVKSENLLAMSLSELGHYTEALPGLEKGFRRSSDPEIKRMCGLQLQRAYTGLHRDNKSVEVALELNRLYPDDPEVLYHTAKIYGNSAFLAMQKLGQVAPISVWRYQAGAEVYESQGSNDTAIAEYRQVLALDPKRPGIHYRLGRTLLARSHQMTSPEDVTKALQEFEQELDLDPTNANAAYEIGEIHRQAGQFDEAQKFFEFALKHYPDFEEAHVGLGWVLMSLKKPEESLPHLQKAIVLNAEDEVAWYRLSQAHRALGNSAEQEKALGEYRRLHNRASQQRGLEPVFSPRELTKQELDPSAPQ
jgi:tetratricopeptide (TPR) repeat protein